jgi:hypothetical protein
MPLHRLDGGRSTGLSSGLRIVDVPVPGDLGELPQQGGFITGGSDDYSFHYRGQRCGR